MVNGNEIPSAIRISKKIVLTVGVNLFGKLTNFFVTIYLAKIFKPDIIGIIAFANAISGILFMILKFGLENYIIREVAKKPEQIQNMFKKTFTINLFTFFLSSIIFISLSILIIDDKIESNILIIIFISTIIGIFTEIAIAYFKAFFKIKFEALIRIVYRIPMLIIIIPIIYLSKSLNTYLTSIVLLSVFVALFALFLIKMNLNLTINLTSITKSFKLLKLSFPFAILSIAVFITIQIDIIAVKMIAGNEAAGFYKIASIFYFPFTIIPGSMMGVVLPLLSRFEQLKEKALLVQDYLYKLLLLLAITIVILLSYYYEPIVNTIFDSKYSKSIPVLLILIWAIIPYYLDMLNGNILISRGIEKKVVQVNIYAILISIISNLLFVNKLGIRGAAIATLITVSFKWIVGIIYLKKYRLLYRNHQKSILFLTLNILVFLIINIISANEFLIFYSLLSIMLMIVFAYITKFIEIKELQILRKIIFTK